MRTYLLALTVLFTTSITFAQHTAIPDQNFEQALIDLGLDDVIDGQVLTANISGVTWLDVADYDIEDLTGIEDFTALEILEADSNFLTSIDVSNNLNLYALWLDFNELTEIDLTNNLNLEQVILDYNQISEIDVSFLANLESLWIDENLISELDLSNNPVLVELYCSDNPHLSFINIQNGNNHNLDEFEAIDISASACIQVDDAAAATAGTAFPYNLWGVDPSAIFSEDCSLSSSEFTLLQIQTYPNPTSGLLNVNTSEVLTYSIYGIDGSLIKKSQPLLNNTISLENLKSGVYFVQFQSENKGMETIKIIKK